MDLMSDSIMEVHKFRTFNDMDYWTWEALSIEIDTSLFSKRIIRTMESVIACRGKPNPNRQRPWIRFQSFEGWWKEHEIEIQFIQPGRPMQNGYIDRFNNVYGEAILVAYLFSDIRELRYLTEEWIEEYYEWRHHEALENRTPSEWKQQIQP